jgi:hypothetical protein
MKLKGIYKQIRDLVNDPSGSFTHVHLEEFDDKRTRRIASDLLNRLSRRGVMKRIHETLFVRNVNGN